MQQVTMNGDTITRKKDGRLYLNGEEIVKNKVNITDKLNIILWSSAGGAMFGVILHAYLSNTLFV